MKNQNYFSLSWNAYQDKLCSSFSFLQQNAEFVDMTIAAEGYLVKVHQLIMGIASPYIKELLKSAPCQHPVIFLNNISHTTLSNLLQYIYTGEVAIPENQLAEFFEAAKSLHIVGIEHVSSSTKLISDKDLCDPLNETGNTIQVHVIDEKTKRYEEVLVPCNAKNVTLTTSESKFIDDCQPSLIVPYEVENSSQSQELCTDNIDETTTSIVSRVNVNYLEKDQESTTTLSPLRASELQYTVSTRGALQLILNRYIYNLFSKGNLGATRRWRCIDYRDKKCPASTVTDGNVVIKRTSMHNHPYHDKKIMDKLRKKAIYSTLKLKSTHEKDRELKVTGANPN